MQIIFLSGTKCLGLPQYVNKFLVWHKRFVPAQNVLGPLKGQGISASSKPLVLVQKTILLNADHLFVWHKMFVTATICKQIFGLAQKIWTSTKHFGTCKRTWMSQNRQPCPTCLSSFDNLGEISIGDFSYFSGQNSAEILEEFCFQWTLFFSRRKEEIGKTRWTPQECEQNSDQKSSWIIASSVLNTEQSRRLSLRTFVLAPLIFAHIVTAKENISY